MKKISNLDKLVSAIEKVDFEFTDKQKTTSYRKKNVKPDSINAKMRSFATESKTKEAKFFSKAQPETKEESFLSRIKSALNPKNTPVDSSGLAAGVRDRTSSRPSIITPRFISLDEIRADAARHGYTLEEATAARDRYASTPKMPDMNEDIDPHTRSSWHPGKEGFEDLISRVKQDGQDAHKDLFRWMSNFRAHTIESRRRAGFPSVLYEVPIFDNTLQQAKLFQNVTWGKSFTLNNKMFRLLKSVAKIEAQFLRNYI